MAQRLFGLLAAATLIACGSAPADFEGADNTTPEYEASACETLQTCCQTLNSDQDQTFCTSSTEVRECSQQLNALRSNGRCR